MSQTSGFRLNAVWVGLVAITAVSWLTGSHGSESMRTNEAATSVILLISAVKARLILRKFMDVNHASRALKTITDAWVISTFTLLEGFYVFGTCFWKWIGDYFLH